MTVIGNILLIIASIIYCMLVSALSKAPPRGEYAVGYVWEVLFMNAALFVCLVITALIIGWKGGFQWIQISSTAKFWLVATGLITAMITTALSSLFKYENGPVPAILKFFSGFAPVLIPLMLLTSAFILLNENLRIQVPQAVYHWSLVAVGILGLTGCVAASFGFMQENRRYQTDSAEEIIKQQDENDEDTLKQIDSCDVSKNMVFILVFTDANQRKDIREKAVAKVKTNPQWQQELINRLQNDWAPEAFNFLASNDVDDPKLFVEPVREGALIQAKLIRQSIRNSSHPSHFYAGQFLWEVERVLRTVDKFSNTGTDYGPTIKQLRAALDEPSEFEKPAFQCTALLDDWIKKHP
jgi:hypothetical protein